MVRPVIPVIALSLLALAGCASDAHGDLVQPKDSAKESDPTEDPGSGESPTGEPKPEAGTDVDACFDGKCVIEISGSKTVPLDKKFEIATLDITVASGAVNVQAVFSSGGQGNITLGGEGGVATANNLTMEALEIDGDTAVLQMEATA
ncbi:MAG: hypothetical protein ACRD0P_19395 [Stackebrandtia sp.]